MLYYRQEISLNEYCRIRVAEILRHIARAGTVQLRWYGCRLICYPYPARKGYGTRGTLVGIYNNEVNEAELLDDVRSVVAPLG